MTVFSDDLFKASCAHCDWEMVDGSQRKMKQRSEGHYLATGHDRIDYGYQMRFRGEK